MTRVVATVLAFAAAHVHIPDTQAADRCHTRACLERVARKQCSQQRPRACVERAILTYRLTGWEAAWLRRIPACESGWDPLAYYPSKRAETRAEQHWVRRMDISAGLFAFKPSTWATTPYAHRDQFRAKWSALAAAWMARRGMTSHWECT